MEDDNMETSQTFSEMLQGAINSKAGRSRYDGSKLRRSKLLSSLSSSKIATTNSITTTATTTANTTATTTTTATPRSPSLTRPLSSYKLSKNHSVSTPELRGKFMLQQYYEKVGKCNRNLDFDKENSFDNKFRSSSSTLDIHSRHHYKPTTTTTTNITTTTTTTPSLPEMNIDFDKENRFDYNKFRSSSLDIHSRHHYKPTTTTTTTPSLNNRNLDFDKEENSFDNKFRTPSIDINFRHHYKPTTTTTTTNTTTTTSLPNRGTPLVKTHTHAHHAQNYTLTRAHTDSTRTHTQHTHQSLSLGHLFKTLPNTPNQFIPKPKVTHEIGTTPSHAPKNTEATGDRPSLIEHRPSEARTNELRGLDLVTVKGKDYVKLKLIGQGGSSKVYEVLDEEVKEIKAMKIVKLENTDRETLESYRKEINILEKLKDCSRVVKLFAYEEKGDELVLVMEKGNQDLAGVLKKARMTSEVIPPYTIKHYWAGMLMAVQQIHSHGIIHCDLKPANFLVVETTVKLIDFGISSCLQKDMTSVYINNMAGTYNYMSPESLIQAETTSDNKQRVKLKVKSDVWSLGCILYNFVYGHTPFQYITNPLNKLAAISNPNTKITFKPLQDKHLLDVLKLCLQFDPTERPTIDELLAHPYLTG